MKDLTTDSHLENNYILHDEIDFMELFQILWNEKLKIILITSTAVIFSVFYSLTLPDIYKSETILASTSGSNNNTLSMSSQYAGVASLAGISLPSSGNIDEIAMTMKIIQSLSFFEKFVMNNDLYFNLLAPNGWNAATNKLTINSDIYNEKGKNWVSSQKFSINGKPSMQTAHRVFLKNFLIENDKKTGIITLSYKHYSPFIAQQILESLVLEINEMTRSEDIAIAKDSIKFMETELQNINLNSLRSGMNGLILKQIEIITLANSSPEYFLKTLSPPSAPELKSEPKRAILVILVSIIGFLLIITFIILRHYLFGVLKKI